MSKVGAIEFVSVSIDFMKTTELQQAALHLPKQERAQLAHLLLESVDQLSQSDIEQLWLFEAERRAAQIDRGEVQLVTAEELEAQIQAQFN